MNLIIREKEIEEGRESKEEKKVQKQFYLLFYITEINWQEKIDACSQVIFCLTRRY